MPTSLGQGEIVIIEFNQLQGYKYWGHYPSLYSQRIHKRKETKNTKIGSETDSESDLKTDQHNRVSRLITSISRLIILISQLIHRLVD